MNTAPSDVLTVQAGRVLVADDEENNRTLLRELLQAHGHEVTEAVDGEQALQEVTSSSPDVVILDVMMPKLNGFAVCRRLKEDPRTATVPILLITALADRQDRLTGIGAGANDFLTKPIDTQDVLLRVRDAIRSYSAGV
jgi:CheY-like chemotaxis protein